MNRDQDDDSSDEVSDEIEEFELSSNVNPARNRYSCFQAATVATAVTAIAAGLCLISLQF